MNKIKGSYIDRPKFAQKHPELAKEWHPILNGELTANDVYPRSANKIWWKCVNGHEWLADVNNRTKGGVCPYCPKRKFTHEKSLAYKFPRLVDEWHPKLNGTLTPNDVFAASNKKVWWICVNGHEWFSYIYSRARGNNCPYCSHQKLLPENSLANLCPRLVLEWHTILNGALTPDNVSAHSSQKVWWLCLQGHEWITEISHRTQGNNCPYCSNRKFSPEKSLACVYPKLANEWHPTLNAKLSPKDIYAKSTQKVWWVCAKSHEWFATIISRSNGNNCPYCSRAKLTQERSLASKYPNIANQWNYQKNHKLSPSDVFSKSNKIVWWICSNGHEWEMSIINRIRGSICPFCSGIRASKGNNFGEQYPDIAKEWHPSLNGKLTPCDFTFGSQKKIWWLCKNNHIWQSPIISRTRRSRRCPFCAKETLAHELSLGVIFPELSKEWHPTKNGDLMPIHVSPGSGKIVWWQCQYMHEWQSAVCNRRKSKSCPYCAGRIKPTNELVIIDYTEIAMDIDQIEINNREALVDSIKIIAELRIMVKNLQGLHSTNTNQEVLIDKLRKEIEEKDQNIVSLNKLIKEKNIQINKYKSFCSSYNRQINLSEIQINHHVSTILQFQNKYGLEQLSLNESNDVNFLSRLAAWKQEGYCVLLPEEIIDEMVREALITESTRIFGPRDLTSSNFIDTVKLIAQPPETEGKPLTNKNINKSDMAIFYNNNQSSAISLDLDDYITCLECDLQLESLDWHLKVSHAMDSNSYRRKHNLPPDFPLVAPSMLNHNN